jgi:hypothetical protein
MVLALVAGCEPGSSRDLDVAGEDAQTRDAARLDGGPRDAGRAFDARPGDASARADALVSDASIGLDASGDAFSSDAGERDATTLDAAELDAADADAGPPPTYAVDVQPIFAAHCAGSSCHSGATSRACAGTRCFVDLYEDTQLPSAWCFSLGITSGACAPIMIRGGQMPLGMPGTVPGAEIAILDAWVAGGQLP